MSGTLYIVSTPIGNLEDITLRAIRLLKEVALIAAEDTRHTKKLLTHYEIDTHLTSYHDFNKEEKAPVLISRLQVGESMALVVDAGTPTVSDPGYFLINQAILAGITITPIPGATAVIAALSVSGLPSDRFIFEGFLPRKKGARAKRIMALESEVRTVIFYESPYRIVPLLEEIHSLLGNRRVAICREITKKFEEIARGEVYAVLQAFRGRKILGEFTLVVEGIKDRPQKKGRVYDGSGEQEEYHVEEV
jgi:16S rRNA (cytidine1402-2'-O)-methyltransferase